MTSAPRPLDLAPWLAEPAEAWRSEVALEMWVDTGDDPVVVYLAGTLTDGTGANVAAVVRGLVEEGHHDVVIDVGHLSLDDGWFDVLCGIRREARGAGGSVTWSFGPDSATGPLLALHLAGPGHGAPAVHPA